MMTNPSMDTTAAPAGGASNVGTRDDLQRFSDRFEQALRDAEDRSAADSANGQQAADAAAARQAISPDDDSGGHDAHDDERDDQLAAASATSVTAPSLHAASTAHAASAASSTSDPHAASTATQGAIGAGLASNVPTAAPVLAAHVDSPNAWSLTLPGLEAWSMRATQPHAGGAWTLDLAAPAGGNAIHRDAAAGATGATTIAAIDAASLAGQAAVLSQRLAARDVAVDRVTVRRRGVGDAADDDGAIVDAAVPGAIDAARGHRRRE